VAKRALALAAAVAVPVAVSAIRAPKANTPAPLAVRADAAALAATVLVRARTRGEGCTLGPLPDRRCSPGALDRRRTTRVVCSPDFHTSDVRDVPDSVKHRVEAEYGLAPKAYGDTLEIDHIISLELGGSNDIANLYPELAPGFRVKDALENTLHKLVCSGAITLHTAQRRIAADWTRLYQAVFGKAPATAGDMRRKKQ
jgi:hypothetical protein